MITIEDLKKEMPLICEKHRIAYVDAFGIELEIVAEESADGLTFVARYRLTEFEGYLVEDTKHRPVFQTILIPFSGSAQSHMPLLIEIGVGPGRSTTRYIYLTLKNV